MATNPNTSKKVSESFEVLSKLKSLPGEVISKGRDLSSGESVFVKHYLLSSSSSKAAWAESFLKVTQRLRGLKSPYLVPLRSSEIGEDAFVATFDYITGEFLNDYVSRVDLDQVPLYVRFEFLRGLVNALSFLGSNNIYTGSIHPSNILVSSRTGKAIILDPGISRLTGISVTGFSSHVTPYLPPECITGRVVNPTSDVFSAAVIAFQLLTGKLPFRSVNMASLGSRIEQNRVPIIDVLPGATSELDNVFHKALSSQVSERFQSPNSFMEALEGSLHAAGLVNSENIQINFKSSPDDSISTVKESIKSDIYSLKQRWRAKVVSIKGTPTKLFTTKPGKIAVVVMALGVGVLVFSTGQRTVEHSVPSSASVDSNTTGTNGVLKPEQEKELVKPDLVISPNSVTDSELPNLSLAEYESLVQNVFTTEELALKVLALVVKKGDLLKGEFLKSSFRSPHYRVKINSLKAFEKEKDADIKLIDLLSLSSDEDPLVRGFAAKVIGKFSDRKMLPGLRSWQKQERNAQVSEVLSDSIKLIEK